MAISQQDLDRQKELNKLMADNVITDAEGLELARLRQKIDEALTENADKRLQNAEEELKKKKQLAELLGIQVETSAEELTIGEAKVEQLAEELLAMGEITDANRAAVLVLRERIQDQETLNEGLRAQNEAQQEYNAFAENAGQLAEQLGASIGLAANYQGSLLGKMDSTLTSLASNTEAQEKFKTQLKETFKASNLFAGAFEKILEMTMASAFAYDNAATSFNAATGAAGEYNAAIEAAGSTHQRFGVNAEQAGKAMGDLHANMSGFTNLSKSTAASLAGQTAALERLGVSGATTAKTLDNLSKHMGMGAEEAMAQANSMAEFAAGIGVAPAKMAEDFAAASPLMVKYGKQGTEVFKSLAKTAKSTGIEMGELLGIAEQFDTFEGAATAAGKLNAMLGGQLLNSVELLTASEDERIQMMRDAVTQSGKSWESMNKFEKQSLMAAAGIKDLDTASRLFGENSEEVAEEQKDLNEMMEKSMTVMEKLKQIAMKLAVKLGPVVDAISEWVSAVLEWMDENEFMIQIIGRIILGLGALMILWKGFLALLAISKAITVVTAAATGGLAAANAVLAGSSGPAAGGIRIIGMTAKKAVVGLLALGAAALMAGIGIYFAAKGVAELVKAFAGLDIAQILGAVAAILIFGITIIALVVILGILAYTGLLPLVALGLLAIGAAAMMMGAGMLLAGFAIKLIIDSISGLMQLFIDNVGVLPQVALGMLMIAGAMGAMALAGIGFPLIAMAFGSMAVGVGALAVALALIKTEDIVALGQLGQALSDMTVGRSVAFKASMEGFESALEAADGAGIDVLVGAANFIKLAGFVPTKAEEKMPVPVVIKGSSSSGGGGGGAGPTTVKLYLNEREFANAVIKVMDKKMDLKTG